MLSTPAKRTYRETLEEQGDRGTWVQRQLPLVSVGSLSTLPFPSNSRIRDDEVCYGALVDAVAEFLPRVRAPDFRETRGVDADFVTLRLAPGDRLYTLQHGEGIDFAVMDTRTTTRLNAVRELPDLSFDAIAESRILSKRKKGAKRGDKTFAISVNVYGPRSASYDVGRLLSGASAYLQHPKTIRIGVNYCNPQFLTFSGEDTDMNSLVGISNDPPRARNDRISDTINSILESLEDVAGAPWEWGRLPEGLKSSLKTYQEDGVRFIQQHEEETCSRRLAAELSTLTNTDVDMSESMSYGGLIADSMGLGKTLTMLTAILSSLPLAGKFGNFYNEAETVSGSTRTKATLIVVTSAQLLENWKDEIQRHFVAGAFDVVTFHGQYRPQDASSLVHADLVLTTYATLSADHQNLGILHRMDWYRVVLDEAHWIRNSSSRQFRAASTLATSRRWGLTGTPIQNRLDDLTSLAEFLRLPPFPTRKAFENNVIAPLSRGDPDYYARPLRAYLKAYCLRRTDRCLQLPPSSSQTIVLDFTAEERALYRRVFEQARREMDETVSSRGVLVYNRLFKAVMRTRMLCNLGTLPRRGESLLPRGQDIASCERCDGAGEDVALLLDSFSFCPDCGQSLGLSSPLEEASSSPGGDAEYTYGYLSPADGYSPGHLSPALRNTPGDRSPASGYMPGYLSPASRDTPDRLSPASRNGSQDPTTSHTPSPSRAPTSTKLSAVVQTVKSRGQGIKHLVFSYWTSTLDPLAQMFRDEGISIVAVDGRTNYRDRRRLLEDFREKPEVAVLLMSIGTGAVGLSLTAAEAVHIVEPQWNPSVEEQAVSRVLRMGQTKEVTIFRYMMRDTVEQNIVSLQKGKRDIARFTLDTGADSLSCNLEELKFKLFAETAEPYG